MSDRRLLHPDDERAVSIAVTHVMTIGITTLLIAGLLVGSASMLETQKERAGQQELEAIGDRHAAEIVTAVDRGLRYDSNVTVRSAQPDEAIGGSYTVELIPDGSDCRVRSGYDACIEVSSSEAAHSVQVPISTPNDVHFGGNTVQGGEVVIVYDNTVFPDGRVTIRGDES